MKGKTKRNARLRKRTYRKRQTGGTIVPEDVLYEDNDVCILKPEVKKGVVVFTHYTQPTGMNSLCSSGLKTGKQLKSEGVNFGRSVYHPYIFFRAPYLSNEVDYTSVDTEIASSFGAEKVKESSNVWIRVDPDKTYVYSSEIRAKYTPPFRYGTNEYRSAIENELQKSRKTLTEYLKIIGDNARHTAAVGAYKFKYDLHSSRVTNRVSSYHKAFSFSNSFSNTFSNSDSNYPYNSYPINISSEILVRLQHLTPNYFVKCT